MFVILVKGSDTLIWCLIIEELRMEVMDTKTFDLVVIGSGPGGEKGAAQAAYFGKKVALIEREDVLGGAAANTGTLPSKTLRESALYLSGYRQRGLYGINFGLKNEVTARDFLYRERLVVQSEHRRIIDNIKPCVYTHLTLPTIYSL